VQGYITTIGIECLVGGSAAKFKLRIVVAIVDIAKTITGGVESHSKPAVKVF